MLSIDYTRFEWVETGNECVIAMAEIHEGFWLGAVCEWLDTMDGKPPFLAFIGEAYADSCEEAEDLLSNCTDGNVVEEIGWFRTHDGGAKALAQELGFEWRERY